MVSLQTIENYCKIVGVELINVSDKKEFNSSDTLILQLPCGTPRAVKVISILEELKAAKNQDVHTCTGLEALNLRLSVDEDGWCVSIKDTLGRGVYPIAHCPGCGAKLVN